MPENAKITKKGQVVLKPVKTVAGSLSSYAKNGGMHSKEARERTWDEEKKMIERNIELSAEFSRHLFEHPEIEEKISVDAEIILLPEFDKGLKEFNLQLGKNIESEGGKVIYISIKQIRPKALSRIEKIELESLA
jgi:hypothetical protein